MERCGHYITRSSRSSHCRPRAKAAKASRLRDAPREAPYGYRTSRRPGAFASAPSSRGGRSRPDQRQSRLLRRCGRHPSRRCRSRRRCPRRWFSSSSQRSSSHQSRWTTSAHQSARPPPRPRPTRPRFSRVRSARYCSLQGSLLHPSLPLLHPPPPHLLPPSFPLLPPPPPRRLPR